MLLTHLQARFSKTVQMQNPRERPPISYRYAASCFTLMRWLSVIGFSGTVCGCSFLTSGSSLFRFKEAASTTGLQVCRSWLSEPARETGLRLPPVENPGVLGNTGSARQHQSTWPVVKIQMPHTHFSLVSRFGRAPAPTCKSVLRYAVA